MEEIPNWYVITGAPCSGKSTTIQYLKKLGFYIVEEIAREIIVEELRKGKTIEEIRLNEKEFQREVLERKLDIEKRVPRDKVVFFDRGVEDSLAYYELYGLDVNEVLEYCKVKRYRKIFLLEMLPYRKDGIRVEDESTAKRIEKLLEKWYRTLNYEVIFVPVAPVEERVRIILSHVEKNLKPMKVS